MVCRRITNFHFVRHPWPTDTFLFQGKQSCQLSWIISRMRNLTWMEVFHRWSNCQCQDTIIATTVRGRESNRRSDWFTLTLLVPCQCTTLVCLARRRQGDTMVMLGWWRRLQSVSLGEWRSGALSKLSAGWWGRSPWNNGTSFSMNLKLDTMVYCNIYRCVFRRGWEVGIHELMECFPVASTIPSPFRAAFESATRGGRGRLFI